MSLGGGWTGFSVRTADGILGQNRGKHVPTLDKGEEILKAESECRAQTETPLCRVPLCFELACARGNLSAGLPCP